MKEKDEVFKKKLQFEILRIYKTKINELDQNYRITKSTVEKMRKVTHQKNLKTHLFTEREAKLYMKFLTEDYSILIK